MFIGLLKASPESKKSLIAWLVECFERNGDRGKVTEVAEYYKLSNSIE